MSLKISKGFTLIEMVVVIGILSVVSSITVYFLINSLKIYTMMVNQKTLLDEGKLTLERMVRDIRDAKSITLPIAGGTDNQIAFTRTNPTGPGQDNPNENITFRLNVAILEKVKSSPPTTSAMAGNVSAFTITRGATENEIKMTFTFSLGSGEKVTLQTKVYPKNLWDSGTYKNFFGNWQEALSS